MNPMGIAGIPVIALFAIAAFVPIAIGQMAVSAQTVCSSSPTNLGGKDGTSKLPVENSDPVASGNSVYAAWSTGVAGNSEIYLAVSSDSGKSFSAPSNLSNDPKISDDPRVDVQGSNVYVVWLDTSPGKQAVEFAVSHDAGLTFGPATLLSNDTENALGPQIASSGSSVYVVWSESSPHKPDVYLRSSEDNGTTFGPIVNLSKDKGVSREVSLVASGLDLYIAWEDSTMGVGNAYFVASHDGGKTFQPLVILSSTLHRAMEPLLAASGSNVYATWREQVAAHNSEVFVRASHDNGVSFGPAINLSDNPGVSREAMVAAYSSSVYTVWRDNTTGTYDVYFRSSSDNGSSFGPTIDVSGNTGISVISPFYDIPTVVASLKTVAVVWDGSNAGTYQVFLSTSHDDGTTFGASVDVSHSVGTSDSPLAAISADRVFVMWQENVGLHEKTNVFFSVCSA